MTSVLAVCGSAAPGRGPLGPDEATGNVCMQDVTTSVVTFGWPYVRNAGGTPAVITAVALAHSRGVKLLTAFAVPQTGTVGYGAQLGPPPGDLRLPGFQWSEHRDAVGATIRKSQQVKQTDLLYVVEMLSDRATASGVIVRYRVGSQHYTLTTGWGFTFLRPGQTCHK